MAKNFIILWIAHLLIFSGCAWKTETIEKKEPVLNVTVGMNKAEVLNILNRPDFTSSSEGLTIFFYCTYLMADSSKGTCAPIFLKDDTVVAVGGKDSKRWALERVRFEVEESGKRDANPFDSIAVETLYAQKTYTPERGDTVYINYHTNFVRYIPLRSNPSKNGKILKTLCIGSELGVVDVLDRWLYVKGVGENFTGWVLKHWVTNNHTVKIDAEKRRKERAPEIARLEAIVKPIPQSKWKKNLGLYEKLSALDPCNFYYQRKVDFYESYGRKVRKRKGK